MGFGQTGYDNIPKGGSGADPSRVAQFFFGTDEQGPQHARRIMFLDGARGMPFGFHLHNHFVNRTNTRIEEVCLIKNSLGKVCPLCEHEVERDGEMKAWFPSYVGCFSVFVMGIPFKGADGRVVINPIVREYKGKTYTGGWERKHLILSRGGDAKPGPLRRLVDLIAGEFGVVAPELPDLTGVVCDVYRSVGKQTDRVGDNWKVVTYQDAPLRVPRDRWLSYMQSRGLATEALERVEKHKLLEPIDHAAYWEARVKTPDQLRDVLAKAYGEAGAPQSGATGGKAGGNAGGQSGGEYEGMPEPPEGFCDDVPF